MMLWKSFLRILSSHHNGHHSHYGNHDHNQKQTNKKTNKQPNKENKNRQTNKQDYKDPAWEVSPVPVAFYALKCLSTPAEIISTIISDTIHSYSFHSRYVCVQTWLGLFCDVDHDKIIETYSEFFWHFHFLFFLLLPLRDLFLFSIFLSRSFWEKGIDVDFGITRGYLFIMDLCTKYFMPDGFWG